MLHAGLDLSRRKLDICLLSDRGEHLDQLVVPPDVGSLKTLAHRIEEVHGEPVCAVLTPVTTCWPSVRPLLISAVVLVIRPTSTGWAVGVPSGPRTSTE